MYEYIHMFSIYMCITYAARIVPRARVNHMRNSICSFNELLFTCSQLLNSPLYWHCKQAVVSAIPWKPIDGIVVSGSSVLPGTQEFPTLSRSLWISPTSLCKSFENTCRETSQPLWFWLALPLKLERNWVISFLSYVKVKDKIFQPSTYSNFPPYSFHFI